MLKYKGYTGKAEIDYEANIIHGQVIDLQDVITFQGRTPDEAEKAFKESIDEYLAFCKELDRAPEKPFSGVFSLRVSPGLHKQIAINASLTGKSLNQWSIEAFEQKLNLSQQPLEKMSIMLLIEDKVLDIASAFSSQSTAHSRSHKVASSMKFETSLN